MPHSTRPPLSRRALRSARRAGLPDDNVGSLAEPDALGVRCDAHLHHERVGAHLRALWLKMVFGKPERLKAELFGENSLAHLVYQSLLRHPVDLRQRALLNVTPSLLVVTG